MRKRWEQIESHDLSCFISARSSFSDRSEITIAPAPRSPIGLGPRAQSFGFGVSTVYVLRNGEGTSTMPSPTFPSKAWPTALQAVPHTYHTRIIHHGNILRTRDTTRAPSRRFMISFSDAQDNNARCWIHDAHYMYDSRSTICSSV